MTTVNRQIQAAAQRMAPQIYNAIALHPDAAGRAQLLRTVLVGIDPALSDHVAASVNELLTRGVPSQQAVLQSIAKGLSAHMHERAAAIGALEGCCYQEMSGLGTMPSAAQLTAISGMITGVGRTAANLTTTVGNIAISAQQTRRGQPVTGLPGMPQPAATALGPEPGYGPAPAPSGGPPWGLIAGGAAVVVVLGAAYWYTTKKKPEPARAAA
jgi:hypothetical protein